MRAISPAAYHLLIRNRWSGNVRELENAIERAVLVCKTGEIAPNDLPETIRDEVPPAHEFTIPPQRTLAEIEKMAIVQTLSGPTGTSRRRRRFWACTARRSTAR